MSQAIEMKRKLLAKRLGVDPLEQTPEFWLDEAIKLEQTARDCGPFDTAYNHFIQQTNDYWAAAQICSMLQETRPVQS